MEATHRQRRNLVEQADEAFVLPIFKPNDSLRNRLENRLRRFLDIQAGSAWRDLSVELKDVRGSLLDIGCGAQIYRELVPADVRYQGIDTVDARERFGYAIPDTHYFTGDDWGVAGESIDTALCTEVLEHIEAPAPFLRQCHDCLRPGGRLILTVPFAARWHFIPYDYWRYTPSSLKHLFAEAGFADIKVTARGNPATVACYKLMALVLLLLLGQGLGRRALGLLLTPLLGATALIANATLRSDWGDDCLGYTVTATRPEQG